MQNTCVALVETTQAMQSFTRQTINIHLRIAPPTIYIACVSFSRKTRTKDQSYGRTNGILKIPERLAVFKPNKFFIWEVKTCTAHPVVKPLINSLESKTLKQPSWKIPMIS